MTTLTANETAGTFGERLIEVVFATMWKPWNALIETRFAVIGYVGFLAVWVVGFAIASVAYLVGKLAGK